MGGHYLRMLAVIVLAYAVIIGLDEVAAGGPGRLLVLGYLLWDVLALRGVRLWRRHAVAGIALALAAAAWATVAASPVLASGLVGGVSLVLTASVIALVALTVIQRDRIDTPAVLGVLSVYLLLALLFASFNQFLAAFNPDGYLAGVQGLPTASDHLYFSVITMTTVGFGDITPASEIAHAVVVVEALVGQLFLVSVVAAVVGGWRRGA